MVYSVSGKLVSRAENYAVLEVGGLGLKIFSSKRVVKSLPQTGENVKLFTFLYWREEGPELYGFLKQEETDFFGLLNSVSGIGPRSALSLLEVADLKELSAAIVENRPDLLTKASGVGRKTAERLIVELKGKIAAKSSGEFIQKMESDSDIVETLVNLGYPRSAIKEVLQKVEGGNSLEERLKAALKLLGKK